MRLKTPFKDYYDGLQSMDLEPEPLYLRKTKEEETASRLMSTMSGFNFPSKDRRDYYVGYEVDLKRAIIGFAGRLFPVLSYEEYIKNPAETGTPAIKKTTFCYSVEETKKLLARVMRERDFEKQNFDSPHHPLQKYFTEDPKWQTPHMVKHFDTYNVPIFILQPSTSWNNEGDKITLNPRLKNWEFARIVPPYEAWRDLSMYWGGKAAPNKPIPEVSDADMIIAKGFDKWSFRKPPSKGK